MRIPTDIEKVSEMCELREIVLKIIIVVIFQARFIVSSKVIGFTYKIMKFSGILKHELTV